MQHSAGEVLPADADMSATTVPELDDADHPAPLPIKMDKRVDLAVAASLVVLGGFVIYVATGFRIGNFPDLLTSRGLPYIIGGFMIAGGSFLVFHRLREWNDLPGNLCVSEGVDDEPNHSGYAWRSFSIAAIAIGWAVLLRDLGFLILTPIALSSMLLILNERSPWKTAAFPLGFTLVLWVTFQLILNLNLPLGPLDGIARAWGII